MEITRYSFGKITIDGKTYTSDLILYPDHIDPAWWRKEGHSLAVEDIRTVLDAKPELLIIGTGFYGFMKVPEETLRLIAAEGIEVQAEKTSKAVELLQTVGKRRAAAALHLTC